MSSHQTVKRVVLVTALGCCPMAARGETSRGQGVTVQETFTAVEALVDVTFSPAMLRAAGLQAVANWNEEAAASVRAGSTPSRTQSAPVRDELVYWFDLDEPGSTFQIETSDGVLSKVLDGSLYVTGRPLALKSEDGTTTSLNALDVSPAGSADTGLSLSASRGGPAGERVFTFADARASFDQETRTLFVQANVRLADDLATALAVPDAAGAIVGTVSLFARMKLEQSVVFDANGEVISVALPGQGGQPEGPGTVCDSTGPDVIVGSLPDISNYSSVGGIEAFAVGTTSCNIGDTELLWIANSTNHPVIGQNMYRLKDGRFEQIGMSWLKHGFTALQGGECSSGNPFCTCTPSGTGSRLGVGCSDPYSSGLNGSQGGLGPRFEVNPNTGAFLWPYTGDGTTGNSIFKRVQVKISDLDPAQDGGGSYFVEGQYVTPDDAAANNQNNNASYRPVTISGAGSSWSASLTGTTQREQPAIRAWQDTDPTVTETDVQVPGDGLVIVSAQATDLGGGMWHYEYAVHNLNVHRGFDSFSVPIGSGATNVGFHDVDYHSGDGEGNVTRDGTDWTSSTGGGAVSWNMVDLAGDNDNALLWGTLYNFRFDAPVPPSPTPVNVTLGLWRAGSPTSVQVSTVGPTAGPADCNGNGVPDDQDIAMGTSQDCANGGPNGIPDECEMPCTLRSRRVATGLSSPVFVGSDGVNTSRLYIVEQGGRIKILDLTTGIVSPTLYLDISGIITSGGERGLLSVAFHPQFGAGSPYLFVNYTNVSGNTVVARYTATGSNPAATTANAGSAVILKTIVQDFANHNGGQLQFGPDGMLYVGMGDGGSGDDPNERAQNDGSLLGKMLRLDVDNPPTYIPADNPFVGGGLPLDEIWAKGLRNPWRFSFDALTGDMYIGDVGQSSREEIDFAPASSVGGENYGWDCREGFICAPGNPGDVGCSCAGTYDDPILDVSHADSGTCSITGGYVYRGCDIPGLSGTYFYSDYCGNWMRSFVYHPGDPTPPPWTNRTGELTPDIGAIDDVVSFGEDAFGELYWVSLLGSVYKIECALPPECGNGILEAGEECDDGNTANGDGCNQDCLTEGICGNGVIELGEECDDGNTAAGDGCSPGCLIESADNCSTPSPITEGTFGFDTTGATTDGPAHAQCQFDGQTYNDIWYQYTPDCSGNLTISLCGSGYDTDLVIYNGCNCGALNLLACNDDNCPGGAPDAYRSFLPWSAGGFPTVPVTAGNCYLIRVGGWKSGDQGTGTITITNSGAPCAACGDGSVDPGEQCDDGNTANGDGCDGTCAVEGDYITGGRMYDKWWTQVGLPAPSGDHPLWAFRPDPVTNTATGADTWRCKECHGWDYLGDSGQYGPGSPHHTGFGGILGTTMTPAQLRTLLTQPPSNPGPGPGVLNGHDLGSTGLTTAQIDDLVAFCLAGGSIDDTPYVNPTTGVFNGNQAQGQTNYTTTGSCIVCHGSDGAQINFSGDCFAPEYVGTVAYNNPWEMLHKVRFGQPGTPMPSWEATGPVQGAADIGKYAQNVLAVECAIGAACTQCDDTNECTDDSCDGRFCAFDNNTDLCAGGSGICQGGICIDPGDTRVFMVRVDEEASAPTAGPTSLTMAPNSTATIEVWVADTDPELLNGYQIALPAEATPQAGATGSITYVDNPDPVTAGDSVFVDVNDPDWVFFGLSSTPYYSETGLPVGFAFLANVAFGTGVSVDGLAYLGEFQFTASSDADGTFTLEFLPDGAPPNGGSGLADETGIGQIFAYYQPLEITVQASPPCTTASDCGDVDQNGIIDDACFWFECDTGTCNSIARVFGDAGGSFGACPPDGFANIHDSNHALSCFSGVNTCDPINHDLGGAFGACPPDGFCNIHDANHALAAFSGTSACSCPLGAAPESAPQVVATATLSAAADRRVVRPGDEVRVSVWIDGPLDDLRSYQLNVVADGGRSGRLELIDIEVAPRQGHVFEQRTDRFDAYNVAKGQMLYGLEGDGLATSAHAYLATYAYRVSDDAAGTFVVDVSAHDQTFLIASFDGMIEVTSTSPAVVVVAQGPARSVR